MKDRTKKSKSPWMKYFVINSTKRDDLAKAQAETVEQIVDNLKRGKSNKNLK